jgi:hypothetical protein
MNSLESQLRKNSIGAGLRPSSCLRLLREPITGAYVEAMAAPWKVYDQATAYLSQSEVKAQ